MKRLFFLVFFLLLSTTASADYAQIQKFSNELSEKLLLNTSHLNRITSSIRISKARGLQLYIMNKTGAEASYNDVFNQILLRPINFVGNRIKSFSDYPQGSQYQFYPLASTIFHELAHADYDVYIENSNIQIRHFIQQTLMKWFKANFPRYSAKIAAHELFGYTAGDSILNLSFAVNDILSAHGINPTTGKCLSQRGLERIAQRLDLDEKLEFKQLKEDLPFYRKFVPDYIFVKGHDLNLKSKNFPESYKERVYDYFIQQYDMPTTYDDLIKKLNRSHYYQRLQNCYKDILQKR